MDKDGEHIFKLHVEVLKGPSTTLDIVVNMTPFIGLPDSISDMVFLKDGTKQTLSE